MTEIPLNYSCHTAENALGSAYDEQPENKQPVLERPAWPNYDLHDDRSFAAFSHVQTAPKDEGVYVMKEDGSIDGTRTTLYRCKDATYLCYDFDVPDYQDWWFFRESKTSISRDHRLDAEHARCRVSILCKILRRQRAERRWSEVPFTLL